MTGQEKKNKPTSIRSMAELSVFKQQFEEATDSETLSEEQRAVFAQRVAYLERRKPTHNVVSIVAYCWASENSILKMCMSRLG